MGGKGGDQPPDLGPFLKNFRCGKGRLASEFSFSLAVRAAVLHFTSMFTGFVQPSSGADAGPG